MPDRFVVTIDLGNDAMHTPEHIAGALETVAERVVAGDQEGAVADYNGNTVCRFAYEDES